MTILGAIVLTIVIVAILAFIVGVFFEVDWLTAVGFGVMLLTTIGTLIWLIVSAWTEALS